MRRAAVAAAALALLAVPLARAQVAERPTVRDLDPRVRDLESTIIQLDDQGRQISVEVASPQQVELRLAADVFFAFGQATLTPEAIAALDEIVPRLRDEATAPVSVEGHTDSVDDDAFNQTLSEARAEAVRAYLADPSRLPGLAFQAQGFGETMPVAPNANPDGTDDPVGRAQNRRVEVRYVPR